MTSYSQMRWDALAVDRQKRLATNYTGPAPWIVDCLGTGASPVIATTDYVRAVPDLIRPWIRSRYVTLGTDGFGRSDTRKALRRFFEIDRSSIVLTAIEALVEDGSMERSVLVKCRSRYGRDASTPAPWLI